MKKLYIFVIGYKTGTCDTTVVRSSLKAIRKEHTYYKRAYRCGPINKIYIDTGAK